MSRRRHIAFAVVSVGTASVGCADVPPPLWHRLAQGGAPTGAGGEGGGQGGAMTPALPVCRGLDDRDCARVEKLSAGTWHTCASLSDGTLRCWGSNASLQLGSGETPQAIHVGPQRVSDLSSPSAVGLGGRHSCAITANSPMADGPVWCWGSNRFGELGSDDHVYQHVPQPVGIDAMRVVAGQSTCAITAAGKVFCWGVLLNGQPFDEYTAAHSATPLQVEVPGRVTAIGIGSRHGCASSDEGVFCWGRNVIGQLGNGSVDNSVTAVEVSSSIALPIHQLSAYAEHTCVLGGDPAVVQCWGMVPLSGVVDTPTTLVDQPDGEVVQLEVGWRHDCVLLADGRVQCWGDNHVFNLGTTAPSSTVPVDVHNLDDATELACGANHCCALRATGDVVCWGSNNFGQLAARPAVKSSPTPLVIDLDLE